VIIYILRVPVYQLEPRHLSGFLCCVAPHQGPCPELCFNVVENGSMMFNVPMLLYWILAPVQSSVFESDQFKSLANTCKWAFAQCMYVWKWQHPLINHEVFQRKKSENYTWFHHKAKSINANCINHTVNYIQNCIKNNANYIIQTANSIMYNVVL
jgi:hypothetical protein